MKVSSVCPYCGVGCGIVIESSNGKVKKILPQQQHPVSLGRLCVKGVTLEKFVNSKERLKQPMIKVGSKFRKTTWQVAIKKIAEEFTRIRDTYGRTSIAVLASTKSTNEENYLLQKFARVVLGNNNIDNSTRLCHATTLFGLYEVLGKSAMTNSYEDLIESNCILMIGVNAACSHPVGFQRLLECKKHGGKIIVVDVRKTETAEHADVFVRINPGTDIVFIVGLINVIREEGLEDKKFIKGRTLGYKQFLAAVKHFSLSYVERITGVDESMIRKIARMYAKAEKAAIVYGMGITQHTNGMENVLALGDLALITGNFGRPGTGINPLRGCNNVQGACDMGCIPERYPGYSLIKESTIAEFSKLWGVRDLPMSRGLAETEMIEAIPEEILAMYVVGQNPMMSLPNLKRVKKNLNNLEFLVLQDVFMTDTAELANIVLPAACFAEKTGTVTNTERRVQLITKAAKPPGRAMEDWKIVQLIAKKMGFGEFFDYKSSEEIFREITKAAADYSHITYSILRKHSVLWPCNECNPRGTKILYTENFGYPGKRAVLYPITYIGPQTYDHAYTFILTTYRKLEQYNTAAMTGKIKELKKSEPFAEINTVDALRLGIHNNDKIKISSPFAEMVVRAKVTSDIGRGTVAVATHYAEVKVNRLIGDTLDPISKTPAYKYCRVKIEKV